MKFEETGLDGVVIEFMAIEEVMEKAGFAYQYDYERVTFDYKMIDQVHNHVYYLRVPAHVENGEVPSASATVKLMKPYLGKHYYPHGVEYDEEFPEHIVEKCNKKLNTIAQEIKSEAT